MSVVVPELTWRPHLGRQEQFHRNSAFEVFYGGAAGGGKSESLLMEATRYLNVPGYTAILFRRTFKELSQPKGLISRSRTYYPMFNGKYNEQRYEWTFPPYNTTITFSHMEHEADREAHKSAEYAYVGFDELTTFLESQYVYLMSRCRTTAIDPATGIAIPARVRAGSNPGDIGHEWVKARFGPWLDEDNPYYPEVDGRIRYYKRVDDVDTEVGPDDRDGLSRTVIRSNLYDNPTLMSADPAYEARLKSLPLVDRERLLVGSWSILLAGNVFKPEWFLRVRVAPAGLKWFRYWDLAASLKEKASFTASAAIAVDPSNADIYIKDMIRIKAEWPDAQKVLKTTCLSETDVVEVGIEKKLHGIAAVQEMQRDKDLLKAHVRLVGVDVDRDKLSRALAWSARAEQGHVYLVEGPWINAFLTEAALFDGSGKSPDDQIDTVSGGVDMAANPRWRRIKFLHL